MTTSQAEMSDRKIREAFKDLITAENLHDGAAERALTWDFQSALFVAKGPDGWHGNDAAAGTQIRTDRSDHADDTVHIELPLAVHRDSAEGPGRRLFSHATSRPMH
jgi:hypothetical protein